MLVAAGAILLGLLLLVAGGESLLRGAVGLATLARLTPAVIGLTVVAAGTSVPELAVSAVATFQGKPDITVGNVVGSNIFNIAFILGLAAVIRPLAISGNTIRLEYPVLAVVTLLCVAVCDMGPSIVWTRSCSWSSTSRSSPTCSVWFGGNSRPENPSNSAPRLKNWARHRFARQDSFRWPGSFFLAWPC